MQNTKALYTDILEGLKLESEYGKIIDLTNNDVISIILAISLVIYILSIRALMFLLC